MMAVVVHAVLAGSIFLQSAAGPSLQSSVEHGILVVRRGEPAARSRATIPDPQGSQVISGAGQRGVQVGKFNRKSVQPVRTESDAIRTKAVNTLNTLADLGFASVRVNPTDTRSRWAYTPKTYHGYHPKPEWTYHGRAGWRYDEAKGWRYRPEPDWAQRPGAVGQILTQLPTSGQSWYVSRWH